MDVNVFVAERDLGTVFDLLRALGIEIDELSARAQNTREGMFIGRWGYYRIDVGYVRRRIVSMLGESDDRVVQWDRIVGELHRS